MKVEDEIKLQKIAALAEDPNFDRIVTLGKDALELSLIHILANFTVDFDSADNANASTNGFYVATGAA